MKKVIEFLQDIRVNNNREWFEAHKARYKEAQEEFNTFTEKLLAGISGFDPSVRGLTVKDCTYRIYRDVRFSPNKDPYKTHMGAYVCPHGKKSGYAGYYFHIEPGVNGLPGQNFLTSGLYMPEPNVLKSARWEIAENTEEFAASIKKAKGFELGQGNKLKKVPAGFEPGAPYEEYVKLKDIYLERAVSDEFLLQDELAKVVTREFARTYDFISILNKAVGYAFEENTDD